MKIPKSAAGLLSATDPHFSLTQDLLFDNCQREWFESYFHGRKSRSIMLKVGGAVHEIAASINRAAKRSPDGIEADDVNRIIRAKAKKLGDYALFKRLHEGLTWVAQEANENREHIVAVEEELSWDTGIKVPWSKKTVRVVGRLDRRGTDVKTGEPKITDYKTAGQPPTREELEEDPQLALYAALYRRKTGYAGIVWAEWGSVLQQKMMPPAAMGPADADLAEQWIMGTIERAIEAIKKEKFPATPYRRCGDCPISGKCDAWKKERTALGVEGVAPSLSEYMRLGGRESAIGELRDKVKVHILNRLDEAGGILHEAGWRAEMKEGKGGLPERYRGFTTVDEFVAALTEPARTTLRVRRAR